MMLGINNKARLLGSHVYSHTMALQREVKLGAWEREEDEEGVMVAGSGHDSLDIIPSQKIRTVTTVVIILRLFLFYFDVSSLI
jgi:hypothetical protein